MTQTAKLIVGALTDFVMTAGTGLAGYMVAKEGVVMPSPAMWLLVGILGAVAAAKHVRGMLLEPARLAVLLALVPMLAACGSLAPLHVRCKGKGTITATGALQAGAIYGIGGVNTGTLQADCGDGFEYSREKPEPPKP